MNIDHATKEPITVGSCPYHHSDHSVVDPVTVALRSTDVMCDLENVPFQTDCSLFHFYPRDVVSAVLATATWLGGWLAGWLSVTAGIVSK